MSRPLQSCPLASRRLRIRLLRMQHCCQAAHDSAARNSSIACKHGGACDASNTSPNGCQHRCSLSSSQARGLHTTLDGPDPGRALATYWRLCHLTSLSDASSQASPCASTCTAVSMGTAHHWKRMQRVIPQPHGCILFPAFKLTLLAGMREPRAITSNCARISSSCTVMTCLRMPASVSAL